ncbi:MAG: BrnA antitoxin family protein [Spirochaetaceae bacterium]|nr:BrnA antitoxin family protein [Spirochaetaceae bacterium]
MTAEREAELLNELREEEEELAELEETGYFDEGFARLDQKLKAKRHPISIKLPSEVISRFKVIAGQNNIPYQTLIGVVLKRYVDGKIKIEEPLV